VIGSDFVRCVLILAAAGIIFFGQLDGWLLVGLALAFGTVDALFMPAVGALPASMTSSDQLSRVQGLRMLGVRASNAIGPVVAAVALVGGAAGAFGVSGLLFALSLVLLLTVRVHRRPPESREPPWKDLRAGLNHLRTSRNLVPLVIVIGLSEMCFSGPVGVGLVLFVNEHHWTASIVGWILSAFSVGGAASALLLSAVRLRRAGVAMTLSLVITAVLVTVIGMLNLRLAAIAIGGLLGFSSGCAMVLSNALIQQEAEPQYLGRVTAVTTFCTVGLSPLLFPLTGLIAANWGTAVFFLACGGICAVAAAISAWKLHAAQL
jgi:MFS family permease